MSSLNDMRGHFSQLSLAEMDHVFEKAIKSNSIVIMY